MTAMASPRSRHAERLRSRRRRAQQRARRLVALAAVSVLATVTLLLTAFGSGASPAPAVATLPSAPVLPTGVPPRPSVLATVGNLQLKAPLAAEAVTAIGFRGGSAGSLELQPVGRRANEGVLARLWRSIAGAAAAGPVWYQLGAPGTQVLVVGAAPGADVYSPVDGTIAAISSYVIDGRAYGVRIDVRPSSAPSLIVSLTHLSPDPSLAVGSQVLASVSKLGTVVDVASVERQSLARHASAGGNNVAIEVLPAAGSGP